MIALSEAIAGLPATTYQRGSQALSEAARDVGYRVYAIPSDFDLCDTAVNALSHIPAQDTPTPTVWIGFIPSEMHYQEMWEAARAKNLSLLNTPEEHLLAMEFAWSYPRLSERLTPETVILEHPSQWKVAANQLGYPVFVRGSVRSRKESGWNACVATDAIELEGLINHLFASPFRSRGNVLVRRLAHLRHTRQTTGGFPMGREFRVFLYRGAALCMGYYWDGDDPLAILQPPEEADILNLAREAAQCVSTPFLCVDIGQLESGQWIVIEVGDGNFAGIGQGSPQLLWERLAVELAKSRIAPR